MEEIFSDKISIAFCTGSSYFGSFNSNTKGMNGFGKYNFPDGTEYRGFFKNGTFNGFGTVCFPHPNHFVIQGIFNQGQLVQFENLYFTDGLKLKGEFDNSGKLIPKEWKYLTAKDRRFVREIIYGVVGVTKPCEIGSDTPFTQVPPDMYDTGEGLYIPTTGFIKDMRVPFKGTSFVNCKEETEWIQKHCFKGKDETGPKLPSKYFRHIIAKTTVKAMMETRDGIDCDCNDAMRLLVNQDECSTSSEDSTKTSEETQSNNAALTSDASSVLSGYTETDIIEPLQSRCKLQLKDLRWENNNKSESEDSEFNNLKRKSIFY